MTPVAIGQPAVEGLVVAQELALVPQVADARVGPGPPAAFQSGGVGFGGDLRGGPVAVAGQDREGLGRDPVLGGGVTGVVQAPRGVPYVLQLSTGPDAPSSMSSTILMFALCHRC